MTSPRKLIRRAIAIILRDPVEPAEGADILAPPVYLTSCNERVYPGRNYPLTPELLPAILVYTRDEDTEPADSGADGFGPIHRTAKLAIECVTKGDENLDDALDDLTDEVERALLNISERVPAITLFTLTRTELDLFVEDDQVFGSARLSFNCEYWTEGYMEPDTGRATIVLGSWAPDVGANHEADYQPIADANTPPPLITPQP